jgi:electron transfer flavoprotein alpha subunit
LGVTGDVWVFSEKTNLLAELIGGALEMVNHTAGSVAAIVSGGRVDVDAALGYGARRVLWLGECKAGYLVDDYVPTLVSRLEQDRPGVLLVGATRQGRAVAGRIAARCGTTVLTDVTEFRFEDGEMLARRMIFGGGAVRVDKSLGDQVIATVGLGVFATPAQEPPSGEVEEVAFVEPQSRVYLVERKPRQAAAVDLSAARRVVCAGRGIARQEDLHIVEELAETLDAELACTRPLAEGLDWLPRERYIGISGAMIKPDLYLGVGVSGQAQHVIGMSEARRVVAINKDGSAPIFAQADYCIKADLYAIVPALLEALRGK